MTECSHKTGAVFGCEACSARVRAKFREFPLQVERSPTAKPGPLAVPWPVAEKAWAEYARQYGTGQSVERLAERGGFGWSEMDVFHPGWRTEVDPFRLLEQKLAAAEAELDRWKREVLAVLDRLPGAVRVREGGGDEDVLASLAVSIRPQGTKHPAAGVATVDGKATCPKCSHSVESRATYARVPEHRPSQAEALIYERGGFMPPCSDAETVRPPGESADAAHTAHSRLPAGGAVDWELVAGTVVTNGPTCLATRGLILEGQVGAVRRALLHVFDAAISEHTAPIRLPMPEGFK